MHCCSSSSHSHHHPLPARFTSGSVRESLKSRFVRLLCAAFLSLLLAAGVLLFVLWLALRPHRPRFHVASFSSSPLAFSLSVHNPNHHIALFYYTMDARLFVADRLLASAQLLDAPLYQRPNNTTLVHARVAAADGGGGGGVGAFGAVRIDMRSRFRFRVATWDTRKHVMHVSCNVEVGPDGEMLPGVSEKRCALYFI